MGWLRNSNRSVKLLSIAGLTIVSVFLLIPFLLATDTKKTDVEICAGNLKNLYQALQMYCQDNNGVLPSYNICLTAVSKYLNRDEDSTFGIDYMKCPSAVLTAKEPCSYGVNYFFVFDAPSYMGNQSRVLAKVPSTTFLCTDGGHGCIYNPGYDTWKLVVDTDGDGILDTDSYSSEHGGNRYGGFSPRHNKGGNFLFADGTVKWVSLPDFLSNKDKMWGDPTRP